MKHLLLVTVDDPEGIFEAAGELEQDIPELLEPFAQERVKVKVERVKYIPQPGQYREYRVVNP